MQWNGCVSQFLPYLRLYAFFIPLSSDNNYFTNEGAHNIVYSMHVPEKKQQQQQQQLNRGNEIDVSVVAHRQI